MDKIISWLKLKMEENNVNQKTLADRMGVTKPYVSSLLSGRRPITDKTLAKVLVDGFELGPTKAKKEILKVRAKEIGVDTHGLIPVDFNKDMVKVPVLGYASCGPLSQENVLGETYFDSNNLDPKKDYFAMIANGVSMVGKIDSGDKVLIEKHTENINGKIMLFEIRGELGLGYLFFQSGFVEVRKSNKHFADIHMDDPDFKIIGVVRAIIKVNP